MDNHETAFFKGTDPNHERVTRLAAVALDAMKESDYYLEDDKIAVLISNDVTKSDWDRSECGMGFWNFDNPRDLINTLLSHITAVGEGYGVGIGVLEASVETVEDPVAEVIQRALSRIAKEVCNCPKCKARRGEPDNNPLGHAMEEAMEKLLSAMEAHMEEQEKRNGNEA